MGSDTYSAILTHPRFPHWHSLWAQINRRVTRLEAFYGHPETLVNTGHLEDEVDALLLCIANLSDWMHHAPGVGAVLKQQIKTMTCDDDPLALCRDYANTFKHYTRRDPRHRYARQHETTSGSDGRVVASLQIWTQDGPDKSVDALAFAHECIARWELFFTDHGIDDGRPK